MARDAEFKKEIPGFQDTPAAFESLIKSGEAIIAKRKRSEEDQIEDSFAAADQERGK